MLAQKSGGSVVSITASALRCTDPLQRNAPSARCARGHHGGGVVFDRRCSAQHSPVTACGAEHGRTIPLAVIGLPAFAERNTKPMVFVREQSEAKQSEAKRAAEDRND